MANHFGASVDGIERPSTKDGALSRNDSLRRSHEAPRPFSRPTMAHRRSLSTNDMSHRRVMLQGFGSISRYAAYREIRRQEKKDFTRRMGWDNYDPNSFSSSLLKIRRDVSITKTDDDEESALLGKTIVRSDYDSTRSSSVTVSASGATGPCPKDGEESGPSHRSSEISTDESEAGDKISLKKQVSEVHEPDGDPVQALKEMITENRVNVLIIFLPLAWYSHHAHWSDGSIFILNFLAMLPLASMLGVFTEELAAHTNNVIGGLINATFGNAVEMVVAIQALLAEEYRVVQASLIGSVFSNLLLVLGMCFLFGGINHSEQKFIATGAVASIAMLGFSGMALMLPAQFQNISEDGKVGEKEEIQAFDVVIISRIASLLLVIMYGLLLLFQLKTHVHLFEGDDDAVTMIPFSWALIGLVVITAIVTILSEFLVGSIDGFCEEFQLGRSFVGVIILPIVGNAVEHISAVTVAMKDNMDLALGVALGSAVQIALFVLPGVVMVGWITGKEMTLNFPPFEVYLYLLSVFIVALCLSNQRSNWLEGSLLVSFYAMVAVGIYFEKDIDGADSA